jgi:hypothetical protein
MDDLNDPRISAYKPQRRLHLVGLTDAAVIVMALVAAALVVVVLVLMLISHR